MAHPKMAIAQTTTKTHALGSSLTRSCGIPNHMTQEDANAIMARVTRDMEAGRTVEFIAYSNI